ncbi:hypothetical protein K2173_015423 [Erythroxylum novogranatense]|uniref:Uncharacterized protein n=1 Tax=Erythroxylum novogranatense TaxID=1862640 RepID=A0AAV8SRL3_9ROSI|nr:hypothetical protein K2173_015423 [Erythroxylum novogranatense]
MALDKSTATPLLSTITNKPNNKLQVTLPKFSKTHLISLSSTTFKSLSLLTAASFTFAPLLLAEEIEKAALLDFNLTLPIIIVESLFLMVALDKIWLMPLGKFIDERDVAIREKLSSVKDTLKEVIANLGLCVLAYDIRSIDGGFIFPGDGASTYTVAVLAGDFFLS